MHKTLHPLDNVDRLYLLRKEGGRVVTSIQDIVDTSIQRLEEYIQYHGRKLITTTRKKRQHKHQQNKNNQKIVRQTTLWTNKQNLIEGRWKEREIPGPARELKKGWNMKLRVVPVVIGTLCTVINGIGTGTGGIRIKRRAETIQTTALLRSTRIIIRVLEIWGDLLSLRIQWKTIS